MTIPAYRLRPPTRSDVQPYGKFLSDKNISIWLEDACQKPLSETAIEDFILRSGWCHWAIEYDGQFCGLTGLDDPDLSRGQARFFIVLGMTDLWGQGMGTAVTQQVLDYGFRVLQLRKIVSDYLAKNTASERVHKKSGFTVDGRLRADSFRDNRWIDRVIVSILRDEFLSKYS